MSSDPFTRPGVSAGPQEYLIARYTGTGHADTTKYEWACNIQRDTLASCVGHYALTSYIATAENDSHGRVRYQLLQRMREPCGRPPVAQQEQQPIIPSEGGLLQE